MPLNIRFHPSAKLSSKIRWNRLARISLGPELESIGIFATPGTPIARRVEDDHLMNDPYYDESDRKFDNKEFDVRVSRIETTAIAELAKTLQLWVQASPSRHINIRGENDASYLIQNVSNHDLVSTLKNCRLVDIVERESVSSSTTQKSNTRLLGL